MLRNTFGDKSKKVQVMDWCCQASSHYLNQCWHRCMFPYGITRHQWDYKDIIQCTFIKELYFLAATKQLYKWYFPSVRPSVRLSVCPSVCPSVCLSVTPFWLCSHHRIIMNFSGVITNDQSKVRAKGQGQRSKVKVTEVTTQLNRFRTVTPV